MAYTIISQNNNTTTLSDGVNTITVPSRVNLTSGNFTIVEVNNNMATLEDGDGNVYRDIPCVATLAGEGGGGAVSSVNGKTGAVVLNAKDVNAVPQYTELPEADASNVNDIVQFAGTTDANYTHGYIYECVSDGGNPATYSWTAVQVQAGGGGGLPSQTGNAGKFLTTDGTDASWSDKPLVNTAVDSGSVQIASTATPGAFTDYVIIGGTGTASASVIIGNNASTTSARTVCIGKGSQVSAQGGIAIGHNMRASATNAIQIGHALFNKPQINSDANTFKVANANGNFEIMDANGNLPADRLASTTGLADGNYRLRLTMASGVPTLSWVAE